MDLKIAKKYILNRLEKELPKNLYYHGVHHTKNVVEAALVFAEKEKINANEKDIIQTAALYHDAGFLMQYEHNEELAVKLINEILPSFNYSKDQIAIIGEIILTTRINASPQTLLEKIMHDADYDYLGKKNVKKIADSLYFELKENGESYTEKEWIEIQIKFLDNHQYYTDSAIHLRGDNKLKYINYLKSLK